MANLERIYTIPLGDAYMRVRNKRGKRAVAFARAFALRHMKAASVKVSEGVNSLILRDGIQKPPRRIKVRIVKGDDGVAKIWLIGEEEKLKVESEAKKKAEEAKKKEDEQKRKAAEEKKKADEAKKAASGSASAVQKAPAPATAKQQAAPAKPAAAPAQSPTPKPAAAPAPPASQQKK
jgi:ribosomal protein L31E